MISASEARLIVGVLLVVAGAIGPAGSALAQGNQQDATRPDGRVLLDSGGEQLTTVEQRGTTYQVYQVDNYISYASGIEIYADGQRMTDSERAREVLRVVAWRRATRDLSSKNIQDLRKVRRQADEIERAVTPPLEALNYALGVVDELKSTSIATVSAWDLAVKQVPQLEQFETIARELRDELQAWKRASAETSSNAERTVQGLQQIQQGESVDYQRLSRSFRATAAGMQNLSKQSEQLQDRIDTVEKASATIADEGGDIRVVGDLIRRSFGDLASALRSISGQIESFQTSLENQRQNLRSVRNTAQTQHDQLTSSWRARQQAEIRVFGSLGSPVLLLTGGLVLYSLRSDDESVVDRSDAGATAQRVRAGDVSEGRRRTNRTVSGSTRSTSRQSGDPPRPSSNRNARPQPENEEARFCTECGSETEPRWKRCPNCGERI